VSTIKGSEGHHATPIPKVQANLPLPPHVVSSSSTASSAENNRLKAVGQRPQLLDGKPNSE
jgi:hypothetical protein